MNTSPFRANYEIKDPKFLFGRKEELQKLCDFAEGLLQVEIIGHRRFGKTCLVKSFITQQKKNVNRKTYPVYIDVYSDSIEGTTNVYRYLTSQIVASLLDDGYIEEEEMSLEDYTFTPNKNWKKIYKQLGTIEDEIDQIGIFEEATESLSRKIGQTILLVFDEYEKAVDAFDNINGLMHIRRLTNSSNYLSFWIAGASPWKKFIIGSSQDVRGSGVFNGITFNVDVCPIKKEDFHDMWNYECSLIEDSGKREHLESLWEKAYTSSGGVPCFAKEIGGFTYIEDCYPQYYRLKNNFAELVKNLTNGEIKCLRTILVSPQEYDVSEKPDSIVTLERYGLICADDNKFYIASRFFADYIRAGIYEEQLSNEGNFSIDTTVRNIINTFYHINDKWNSIYGKYMFDPTNDTQRLYQDLGTKCDSREKAPNFVNSIYLLYWEGAKENKAGEKIPDQFKWTMFRKSMDRIRHVLGKAHQQDKLAQSAGQIDKATALKEIWGDPTEPQSPQDWLHFQECMLNRFLQELTNIYQSIENQPAVRTVSIQPSVCVPKVVTGTFKKGTFGKQDFVIQDDWNFMHEIRSIRDDEYIEDGDHVEYNLCWEPNPRDSSKKYYYAMDVHYIG